MILATVDRYQVPREEVVPVGTRRVASAQGGASPVLAYFERQAPAYGAASAAGLWAWQRRREAAALAALAGEVEGRAALDLGCGAGFYAIRLADAGARPIIAVDASPAMIAAIADPRIETMVGDAATIALDRRFQLVLLAGLLEFVSDPVAVLANARRCLEPGGRVVALVPPRQFRGPPIPPLPSPARLRHRPVRPPALRGDRRARGARAHEVAGGVSFRRRARDGRAMSRILLLVNGLGLGNSTRCFAVLQRLLAVGAEVEVVTSDNGLWFFADKPEVGRLTEIPSLRYGQKAGRIDIAATLSQAGAMLGAVRRAEAVVADAIARFRPEAVVIDSIYAIRPVRRAGLPLAAINNSDMVTRRMARGGWPIAVLPQFLAVEASDYFFHRLVPDLVVSPRLDPSDAAESGPFRRVGPIVRAECRPGAAHGGRPERVVVMLSGSVLGSPVALARPRPGLTVDVVGRPAPNGGAVPEGVVYHGKVRDSLSLMRDADLLVVNGGFSAVSEALVLRKPVVVIPVPRHAEQWANGECVRRLGLGLVAAEEGLEEAIDAALARIGEFRIAYDALPVVADGAERAAELILDLAAGRRR